MNVEFSMLLNSGLEIENSIVKVILDTSVYSLLLEVPVICIIFFYILSLFSDNFHSPVLVSLYS